MSAMALNDQLYPHVRALGTPNGLLAKGSDIAADGAGGGGDMVGVGRAPIVDKVPVDWGCNIEGGYAGAVADAGGESSHRRSLMASGTAGCAGTGGEVATEPRIDGGIRDGGIVAGSSFPASLPWMRCIATANPSRVRRPSLFMSAKSLHSHESRAYVRHNVSLTRLEQALPPAVVTVA